MPILLTGFDPFATYSSNPSGLLAERLQGRPGLVSTVIPTSYTRAGSLVEDLLRKHTPEAVLLVGLSARARGLVLERRAKNWDDSDTHDNEGVRRNGEHIAEQGPESYLSTLPLERFYALATDAGLPVEMSDDAGSFLCNHVFYRAAHFLTGSGSRAPCGFVHVPLAEGPGELDRIQRCLEGFLGILSER
jgi:pyroglutamyl-peptidase